MGRMENMEMMQKLQAENSSVNVVFIHMNLMDRVNMEQAVKQVMGVIKHIDVLINGAGVLADKDMETTMGVNLVIPKFALQCKFNLFSFRKLIYVLPDGYDEYGLVVYALHG